MLSAQSGAVHGPGAQGLVFTPALRYSRSVEKQAKQEVAYTVAADLSCGDHSIELSGGTGVLNIKHCGCPLCGNLSPGSRRLEAGSAGGRRSQRGRTGGRPAPASYPVGSLRYLVFRVEDLAVAELTAKVIPCEPVRVNEYAGEWMVFSSSPAACRWNCMSKRAEM